MSSPVRRIMVHDLICGKDGLNYCCEWAFFSLYGRTGLIAERLGVCKRAVQYHRMAFKDGNSKCEKLESCLKGKLL